MSTAFISDFAFPPVFPSVEPPAWPALDPSLISLSLCVSRFTPSSRSTPRHRLFFRLLLSLPCLFLCMVKHASFVAVDMTRIAKSNDISDRVRLYRQLVVE